MGQGKRMRRGSRRRVDPLDVVMTLFYSDASEEEVMAMTRAQRKAAQAEGLRMREAPGYRSWDDEVSKVGKAWEEFRWNPGEISSWREYLASIDRLDLYRSIAAAGPNDFTCGRCGAAHDRPWCIPNEPRWLCQACAEGSGQPVQAGRWKPRRGA